MNKEEELELSNLSFDTLNIKENILRGIYAYGFENPSLIQYKAIPKIIEGIDIIAQAQSGTGKTGAFSIGVINKLNETLNDSQAIILSPTRELAEQTFNVLKELTSYTKITMCKVIGGTSVIECQKSLKKNPHIVVGTPGRVFDMLDRKLFYTEKVKTFIIDEADELLSQGFLENIHGIFKFKNSNSEGKFNIRRY